jgi:general secretion pathway protein C
MNIDFNKLIQKLIPYAFILLIAYLISTIIFVFLPKDGVDFIDNSSQTLEYKKYDGFYSNAKTIEKKKEVKKIIKQETLSKYILKAIYSTTSNAGWITIENKENKKSYILSQFEEVNGYILTKLYKNYVILEKQAKEYRLDIEQVNKKVTYDIARNVNNVKENVVVSGNSVVVKREYLNSYVNDIDKVWNNIAISEIKKNNKLDGFKVMRVSEKSVFGKLGLKKNDVIKAINNNVLTSYADAFKVYNNISDMKYLNLEILRNNEIMELNYEID